MRKAFSFTAHVNLLCRKRRRKDGRPPLGSDLDQPYSLGNMSASQVSVTSDISSDHGLFDPPAPISLPPKPSLPVLLKINSIEASRLKRVKWNGKNDPYVVLSLGNHWRYETEVVWSAPDPVIWTIDTTTTSNPAKKNRQDELLIEVYSANLVREDQLIGSGSIPLSHLMPTVPRSVSVNLVNAETEAGVVSLLLTLEETTDVVDFPSSAINERNQHNREKSDYQKYRMLEVKSQPNESKENTKPNHENNPKTIPDSKQSSSVTEEKLQRSVRRSDTTPGTKVAEAKTKKSHEVSSGRKLTEAKETSTNVQPPRQVPASSRRSESIPKPSKSLEGVKPDQTISSDSLPKHSGAKSETKRTIRQPSKEEGVEVTDDEAKKVKITVKKKKKVLPVASTSLVDTFVPFDINQIDISPDTHRRVVDKALETSVREESSSVTLFTHEVALVLDALNFPLNDGVINPVASQIDVESSQCGASMYSRSSKSSILLSLQNPALLAASLTEFSRDKQLVNVSQLPSRSKPFSLTEYQSITAIRQLLALIYGPWKKARKLILTAAETAVSFGGGRPSYWTAKWIEKLIAILEFPSNKFLDYNGEDFILLDDHHIGQLLKSSILKARCRLYVKLLYLLDSWWDQNISPSDTLAIPSKIQTSRAILSEDPKGASKIVPKNSSSSLSQGDNSLKKKKKITKSKGFLEGDCVKIAPPGSLLGAYLPIARAYAWKTTPEDLTALTEVIGGLIGFVSTRSSYGLSQRIEIQGMTWVSFQDEYLTGIVKEQVSHLLRELDEKIEPISGRYVLVPSACLEESSPPQVQQEAQVSKVRLLSSLPLEEITVGMKVRIQPFEVMCKAYEKYDWWDRPSLSLLESFSGKLGNIVSITNVAETGRVGVSVRGPKSMDVVDALPLEALIFLPPANFETQTNDSKKGKKMIAKVSKKPTQVVNENIVSSSIRMNLKPNKSEEPPLFYKRPLPSDKSTHPIHTNTVGESRRFSDKGSISAAKKVGGNSGGGDDYLPEEVNGGEESESSDFDVREEMIKDLRIIENPNNPKPISSVSIHSTSRPLYRPLTTFNLLDPPSPDSGEMTSPIPKYEWMRRSLAPTQSQRQQKETQTKEKDSDEPTLPKFTTTTFDFDVRLSDQHGVSDARNNFTSKSQRSRTSNLTSNPPPSSSSGRRKQQEDSIITDKLNFSSDDNFFVDGIRFGKSSKEGIGNRDDINAYQAPQRPKSAASRPSSAGSTRKSAAGLSSSLKGSVKKQTSDFLSDAEQQQEEQHRDERLKRDLKRAEREIKIKEAALKRQVKRYGVFYDD